MSPKFRPLYLFLGFSGLLFLIVYTLVKLPEFNPEMILMVSVPDMVIFFMAYRTYPASEEIETRRSVQPLSSKI